MKIARFVKPLNAEEKFARELEEWRALTPEGQQNHLHKALQFKWFVLVASLIVIGLYVPLILYDVYTKNDDGSLVFYSDIIFLSIIATPAAIKIPILLISSNKSIISSVSKCCGCFSYLWSIWGFLAGLSYIGSTLAFLPS